MASTTPANCRHAKAGAFRGGSHGSVLAHRPQRPRNKGKMFLVGKHTHTHIHAIVQMHAHTTCTHTRGCAQTHTHAHQYYVCALKAA